MILTKEITIKLNNMHLKHFRNLGYENLKSGIYLTIPIEHLSRGSKYLVYVKCDSCGKEKKLPYIEYNRSTKESIYYVCSSKCGYDIGKNQTTNTKIYGVPYAAQSKVVKNKKIETCLKNHGVEYPFQSENINNKIKKSVFDKYGVSNVMKDENIKKLSNSNRILSISKRPDKKDEYKKYKLRVMYYTKKSKIQLFENWTGFDFYDNEYIKENYNLYTRYHPYYPNIDHKISIIQGFNEKINPEIIGHIDNLCITKRILNLKKHAKSYENN